MVTQAEPQTTTQKSAAMLRDSRTRVLDAVSAFADLNQRVVGGLIELSSEAALETVRTLTELQSATVEAFRAVPVAPETGEAPGSEGWYRKGLDVAVDETQRFVKLLEKNGQILTRSAERRQSSRERVGKEIKEALEVYAEKMRKV
jgi:hypothetical protein